MAKRKKSGVGGDELTTFHDIEVKSFYLEFKNSAQKLAWSIYQNHDILFLLGPAGVGKSHLAMAFAIHDILAKEKYKIITTRPVVEAGENLGFLPGSFTEKIDPYMTPLYDVMDKLTSRISTAQKEKIISSHEVAPLAYLRGRAQPLDASIYTSSGPKLMADIDVGDAVIGSSGKPVNVIGVYPQGLKKVYRVVFSDGSSTECCEDHLWSTRSLSEKRHNKSFSVKDTKKLIATLKTNFKQKNHAVPLTNPVEFIYKSIDINPYLLGLLLGDGNFHETASIKFTNKSISLIESIPDLLPESMVVKSAGAYNYRLVYEKNNGIGNPLRKALVSLGLVGKKAYDKFVPDIYKYNSVEVRLELLRGLMDTDGWIGSNNSGTNRMQYYSTSQRLAEDVVFLVQSLGGVAHTWKREYGDNYSHMYNGHEIKHIHPMFVVDVVLDRFNPFKNPIKADKYLNPTKPKRLIADIVYVGEKECQCIQVDSMDHLYLTDEFIVTHNTFDDAVCILDESQNCSYTQLKLFLTRMGHNCKIIITGDQTQSDLGGTPAIVEVVKRLETAVGIGTVYFKEDSIVRHPLVGEIVKRLAR